MMLSFCVGGATWQAGNVPVALLEGGVGRYGLVTAATEDERLFILGRVKRLAPGMQRRCL